MKQSIRAEDFDIVEDRMILGGRMLEGSSILFAHVEKRVSLELLGYYLIIAIFAVVIYLSTPSNTSLVLIILTFALSFGAYREISRPYVLVMNIYQIGIFEVRGFTEREVMIVEETLDELRRGSPVKGTGFRSWKLPGTSC